MAKASKTAGAAVETIEIPALKRATIKLRLIGTTPMFQNRMTEKAKQSFLAGSSGEGKGKKKTGEIKHHPLDEFRSSAEQMDTGPTALGVRVIAIKAAMCTAALETAGITKTSAQRLIFMPGELFPLYGTPQLRMDIVRSAGIGATPDIRTRAFLPRWGTEIEVSFITPQLGVASIATLLANAGVLVGIGDFRQEKGKGSFGGFRVITADQPDPEWDELVANHGRAAQELALANPAYANEETSELVDFYLSEMRRRAA